MSGWTDLDRVRYALRTCAELNGGAIPRTDGPGRGRRRRAPGRRVHEVAVPLPDRLEEPGAAGQVVGIDEPSGDPQRVVPLVVEDLAGEVGPAERAVEPPAQEPRQRLQGRGMPRGVAPEQGVRGLDQPIAPRSRARGPGRVSPAATWARQKPTTVISKSVSSSSASGGRSSGGPACPRPGRADDARGP